MATENVDVNVAVRTTTASTKAGDLVTAGQHFLRQMMEGVVVGAKKAGSTFWQTSGRRGGLSCATVCRSPCLAPALRALTNVGLTLSLNDRLPAVLARAGSLMSLSASPVRMIFLVIWPCVIFLFRSLTDLKKLYVGSLVIGVTPFFFQEIRALLADSFCRFSRSLRILVRNAGLDI